MNSRPLNVYFSGTLAETVGLMVSEHKMSWEQESSFCVP